MRAEFLEAEKRLATQANKGRAAMLLSAKKAPGRVVAVLPLDVAEALDALAALRWGGNRTAAIADAVMLAVLVYGDDAVSGRLVDHGAEALELVLEAARGPSEG